MTTKSDADPMPSSSMEDTSSYNYPKSGAEKKGDDNQTLKRIKFIVRLLVFTIILVSSVTSKLSLLFMVSHTGENRKIPYCHARYAEEQVFATIPEQQRIAWICAIVFAYALPELIALLKAWLSSSFKKSNDEDESLVALAIVWCIETLHVIGMGLLIFTVLPNLNTMQSVMLTNCLCFVPAVLILVSDGGLKKSNSLFNIPSFIAQTTGFIVWPLMSKNIEVWCTMAAIILVSFHWWENFADFSCFKQLKKSINTTRSNTSLYISPWKIFVFLNCAIFFSNIPFGEFITQSFAGWRNHKIQLTTKSTNLIPELVFASPSAIHWTLVIQIASSFVSYVFARFACKIKMHSLSYTLTINLTVPASIIVLLVVCKARASNLCAFHGVLPDYLFFISPHAYNLHSFIIDQYGLVWIFCILSQIWITRPTWTTNSDESNKSLFVTPIYNGLLNEQSLLLNRRRYNEPMENDPTNVGTPIVYVCATMWHEGVSEMIVFLKSILRLDKDRSKPFEMETHICFDDAYTKDKCLNGFVTSFVGSLGKAAEEVYNSQISTGKRSKTPYGGQLEWTLPGETKLFVHLKNSSKIRNKKRWSQVMYMRYLVEHKNVEQPNKFILALDGDIDFQPEAVHLLFNRMVADENLGAACGRIHPIGKGPIAWYQQFEYAIGHWLQKTTEHVIGCVLCSPGCFSLFRVSALDGKVLETYSKDSTEAEHFVQYDQGEDRWLCTLILKAGKRIEYSAAAQANTHCPDGFEGLFKQRLRWISSTLANTIDFLSNSRRIIYENQSITMPYVVYQVLLLIGTVLSPGTIFLMMVGGIVSVFDVDISTVFLWNLLPIVMFMMVCYKCPKYQLTVAVFLSGVYSLVMMTVVIAMIIQIMREGVVSSSSVFFILVIGQILVTALLHPHEWGCLPYGILYYMTIPTMYMLLIIYAIFNINNPSWGTREDENVSDHESSKISGGTHWRGLSMCLCCSTVEMSLPARNLPTKLNQKFEAAKVVRHPYRLVKTKRSLVRAPFRIQNQVSQVPKKPEENDNWLNDDAIHTCQLKEIELEEWSFWHKIIKKLDPTNPPSNNESQDKFKLKLDKLRDNCAFIFVVANTMFVLVVFAFQLNKDYFFIRWPFGSREYSQVEPLGLLFIAFFGFILVIQFIAMLVHRFDTLCEVLASTESVARNDNYKSREKPVDSIV